MRNILNGKGLLNSVYPCTEYLTFGPWIYLVPQYKPENVLMLGYAGGTTAGLIKLIHGDVPITAIDIKFVEDPYDINFIEQDAEIYVKDCPAYDCVIVDLYEDVHPCEFIYKKEFANNLKRISNYLIIHAQDYSDMHAYYDFRLIKKLSLDTSRFHYYMIKRVGIPIR